ncbi:MAG: DUF4339 domain-containing protein [Planctomycetota bacterium]|nr:MAG: DUF4339 domain-containing protein [Planctomycetota bacterium]
MFRYAFGECEGARNAVRCFAAVLLLGCCVPAMAQTGLDAGRPTRGFDVVVRPSATGQERKTIPDLWVLEVHLKSLRLVRLNLPQGTKGTVEPRLVWYLVFKAVHRPFPAVEDASDTAPVNTFDPPPTPPLFAPEALLVTRDQGPQRVYRDRVVPGARALIEQRERQKLKTTVELVGPLPPPASDDDAAAEALYGVFMWQDVDPEADYFTIYLQGFSNGYKYVRGPVSYADLARMVQAGELRSTDEAWDGKGEWRLLADVGDLFDPLGNPPEDVDAANWFFTVTPDRFGDEPPVVWRKVLKIDFWRPGDRFELKESEFRLQGTPQWIYRPVGVLKSAAKTQAEASAAGGGK